MIVITGSCGFIGFHLSKYLLEKGYYILGIDNLNSYYSVELKEARLKILNNYYNFKFVKIDLANSSKFNKIVETYLKQNSIRAFIHLAAQPGVRFSISNPEIYFKNNIYAFFNILEFLRKYNNVEHFIFASSSSVYGLNRKLPFSEEDKTDFPASFYGATKKVDEIMAFSYSLLYQIPTTGLRFFTVYGPWGRPDMAYFKFTDKIIKGEEIEIYNFGKLQRDFTYIDDIINTIGIMVEKGFIKKEKENPFFNLYNIGGSNPVELMYFIELLEKYIGKKANKKFVEFQKGDLEKTWADVENLEKDYNYKPKVSIEEGLKKFVEWYKDFYL